MIPFNKPYLTGKETHYLYQAVLSGKISGNGIFTQKCHQFFKDRYGFKQCLLTTSCTDALEMSAILIDTQEGDEIIIPSFTFVSTANAFVLRGAKIIFADSCSDNPNIDASKIEELITPKTKAIVVVHYAGVPCDMDEIMQIARKHNLYVIEDAAQAIDSYYKGKALGSIGHLAAFSFHETKNIISGEGGMLVINDEKFSSRAEIIWEKGTNRTAFFRGEIDKYGWMDIGSSFLPSEIIAAFLYAQLENIDKIQKKRKEIWQNYSGGLKELSDSKKIKCIEIQDDSTNNGHLFYIKCKNFEERKALIEFLNNNGINAVFHYLSLHKSPFYHQKHDDRQLMHSEQFSDCLVRLPLYFELSNEQQTKVINTIKEFYNQ